MTDPDAPPAMDEAILVLAKALDDQLLVITELLKPLRAAAVGLRTQLSDDGWSPGIAEALASAFLASQVEALLRKIPT